jgi:hypothetical protein
MERAPLVYLAGAMEQGAVGGSWQWRIYFQVEVKRSPLVLRQVEVWSNEVTIETNTEVGSCIRKVYINEVYRL